MKCDKAQQILVNGEGGGFRTSELEDALNHAHTCRTCADFLSFSYQLTETLGQTPVAAPDLTGDIRVSISNSHAKPSWMQQNRKTKLMKQLTFSAAFVTVAATVIVGSLSGSAQASTAKDRFETMTKAVLANKKAAQDGNGKLYTYTINGVTTAESGDGEIHVWVQADGTIVDCVNVVYTTADTGDGKNKAVIHVKPNVKNSKPVQVNLNLSPKAYKSINYGANKNTLVLQPKDKAESYVVSLDAKSSLPVKIQTIRYSVRLKDGRTAEVTKKP